MLRAEASLQYRISVKTPSPQARKNMTGLNQALHQVCLVATVFFDLFYLVKKWNLDCRHGPGKWRQIQQDPEFNIYLSNRTNVDLKDKWRNLSMESAQARKSGNGAELIKVISIIPSIWLARI